MRPLLFDLTPFHGMVFTIAAAIWAVPELLGAFVLRSGANATRRDRGSYPVVVGGIALGFIGAFLCATLLPQLAVTSFREPIFWLGIALMLGGVAVRWYAILTLGRSFTQDVATRADQELVERGPYRAVRHPAYSATLLTMLGVGVALGNWGSLLVITLGGLVALLYRIRIEEDALLDAFGPAYRDYMQRTSRLIPFIW